MKRGTYRVRVSMSFDSLENLCKDRDYPITLFYCRSFSYSTNIPPFLFSLTTKIYPSDLLNKSVLRSIRSLETHNLMGYDASVVASGLSTVVYRCR